MADALAIELCLGTASVKGTITMFVGIGDGLTIPIELKVISHFDAGAGQDAGLLLEGPGDLLFFIGYSEKTKDLRLAMIDRAAMTRKPKKVMGSTGFIDIALKRFNEGDAVRGMWTQASRKDPWKEA
jgi:hypothetical protein